MNIKQKQDFKSEEVLKYLLLWTRLIGSYKGIHTKEKRSLLYHPTVVLWAWEINAIDNKT